MNRRILKILANLVVFSLLVSVATAGEVEITVNQSAVINPPDSLTGRYGPRFLLYFDLPSELDGKEITFAEFTSTGNFPSVNNGAPITVEACPVTTSWGGGVSWNTPWTNPGGDYDLNRQEICTLKTGGVRSVFVDITKIIERWVSGRARNHGLILIPVKMDGEAYTEFSDPNGTFRSQAKLKIYY